MALLLVCLVFLCDYIIPHFGVALLFILGENIWI